MGDLMKRLQRLGVERIVIDREVTADEIATLVGAFASTDLRQAGAGEHLALPPLAHIQIGRIQVEQRVDTSLADAAAIRATYNEASTVAERLWQQSALEGRPDPGAARGMVDTLAQAVAQNRPALIALTALKNYDNYTFTHMVNVSILTMAQARALGIEGTLLREFGIAGLMHDIGKVRTPSEILNKPDKLTDAEFEIMRRHVVDGAAILRRTPEMPAMAPVVAFEHHLRLDGSGYPRQITRNSLNVATMLCSIADVYDAMRSQRSTRRRIRAIGSGPCSSSTAASSIPISCAGSCSCSASTRRATSCGSTRRRSPSSCRCTRRSRTGRASASCAAATARRSTGPTT